MIACRAGQIIASLILFATVAGTAVIVAVDTSLPTLSSQDPVEGWGFMLAFVACSLAGAVILLRRPKHAIGWLLAVVGLLPLVAVPLERWGIYVMLTRGEPDLATHLGFWLNNWYWYVLIALVLVYLPLLFPTGQLPTPRWRLPALLPTAAVAAMVVLGGLQPTMGSQEERSIVIANPVGVAGTPHPEEGAVAGVLFAVLLFGMLLGVGAVVVRFRRSSGVEREQLKWFFLPVLVLPFDMVVEALPLPEVVSALAMPATIAAFPVAIGVAITRYRLYDLGRLVSRTVTYVVVAGLLLGVYAGGVLLLGTVARAVVGERGDLVVALSTLLVAAAFQPVRRQVQALIDRRFNRSRYDAARTIESFGNHLRDEIDPDTVAVHLRDVVATSLHPLSASVWVRREVTP